MGVAGLLLPGRPSVYQKAPLSPTARPTGDGVLSAALAAAAKNEMGRPVPLAKSFGVNEKDQAWVDAKMTQQPTLVSLQPGTRHNHRRSRVSNFAQIPPRERAY
jgi:hypothetical protein